MNKSYNDLGMYCGSNSIYEAMRDYAAMVFPPVCGMHSCSDNTSRVLLNVMIGVPIMSIAFHLRVYLKFVATDMLARHLQGNTVDISVARKLYSDEQHVFNSFRKALPPHTEQ